MNSDAKICIKIFLLGTQGQGLVLLGTLSPSYFKEEVGMKGFSWLNTGGDPLANSPVLHFSIFIIGLANCGLDSAAYC